LSSFEETEVTTPPNLTFCLVEEKPQPKVIDYPVGAPMKDQVCFF
jgi:hypothetical protein